MRMKLGLGLMVVSGGDLAYARPGFALCVGWRGVALFARGRGHSAIWAPAYPGRQP